MTMDPMALLKADHREVEMLFADFERSAEQELDTILSVAHQLLTVLSIHAELEEQLLYPMLRDALDEPISVLEAIEEHQVVKLMIRELQAITPEDERFDAKMHVLKETVHHHVEEEEQELLPLAETLLSRAQLDELSTQLIEMKHRLKRQAMGFNVTIIREFPVEQPKQRH
jgi:hemerythrin-like domain-containing protein